jgi:hypothetical protein
MVSMMWDCRLSTGLPPSSRLCRLWSQTGDLQRAGNRDRKAVWDQVGLSHSRHECLVMVRDEAHLRRGHDNQSHRGHQCSETTLTGESLFHIVTPLGIWTWVPCDGKQTGSPLDQWDMVRMMWDCRLSANYLKDRLQTLNDLFINPKILCKIKIDKSIIFMISCSTEIMCSLDFLKFSTETQSTLPLPSCRARTCTVRSALPEIISSQCSSRTLQNIGMYANVHII